MIPVMIIPILNRFDLLQETLNSIDFPIGEILVINNSGKPAPVLACDWPLRVLDLPSNLGVAGSWNLGIKLYPHADYWLFGSADTSFHAGTLESWFDKFDADHICHIYGYGVFALGSSIVDQVGLFDECYYPIYFEDWDYRDRIIAAGLSDRVIGEPTPSERPTTVNDAGGSATIMSSSVFQEKNRDTWIANSERYHKKSMSNDWSVIGWSLSHRKAGEWL